MFLVFTLLVFFSNCKPCTHCVSYLPNAQVSLAETHPDRHGDDPGESMLPGGDLGLANTTPRWDNIPIDDTGNYRVELSFFMQFKNNRIHQNIHRI